MLVIGFKLVQRVHLIFVTKNGGVGRWGDREMGRSGDQEMGEILIKRCSAVLGRQRGLGGPPGDET
ncbi:hypothetical protein BJP34_35480 [Moorena producens PAL-8-15-08-1]|uniref:Uncharacterized protein n=1 Tax=Moorena producens PAL-8-15-08-1 TaxID=1458985 RepID=A0A1D8U2C2_9CYAN|nr:hypothetical protein BJP34_35480 [Moorena producens PAL-8-15-08-1]